MNLIQALAAGRPRNVTRKANPSQVLGGIIIPENASHSQIIDTGKDADLLVKNGWKANIWSYACVDRNSNAVSQVLWKVDHRTGPGENDWQPNPSDWRQNLLDYPAGAIMSSQEVFYYFSAWLQIKGNGLLRKVLGGPNGILELWPMSPKNLYPVPDRQRWISGYNFVEDGKILWNVDAEEIIHARLPDPSDPLWGFGMLEAAFPYVESDTASAKLRRENYANGGVPPAAIVDEDLASQNVAEQAAALQLAFRRNAQNRVPMLMGGKKSLLEFGFSPEDMEIPEDRQLTRDEIVAAFGMLPAMFSTEASTYDNQDGAVRYMYENGAGRLIVAIQEALNLALLTQEEREGDLVYIRPDMSRIPFFQRQRAAKIEQLGKAVRSGVSRNDAVAMLELGLEKLDEDEGGEAIFIESGLTLLSEAAGGLSSESAASTPPDPFAKRQPIPNADPMQTDNADAAEPVNDGQTPA